MPKILTQSQVDRFWRDGCVFPVRVMPEAAALEIRARLEAFEKATGGPLKGALRHKSHLLFTWMADLVRRHPQRIGAYAILPLPHIDAALEELTYALDTLGLDGIGMVTNVGGTYVADTAFDPVLEELGRRGTPVFVHPAASPALPHQPNFGLPGSLYEFPFETVRLAAQMLYNRTLDRYPGLRWILSHGGGGIPYMAERLTYGPIIDPALAERASADPIAALRRIHYDIAMTGNRYSLPSLRALVPADRILIGTDFPFMPEWTSDENARQFQAHGGFSADELSQVDHRNAEALFPRLASDSNATL